YVVQAQPLQAGFECGPRCGMGMRVVPELCGDEQFFARYSAIADTPAHSGLVSINGGRINRPIAQFHGLTNDIGRRLVGYLPSAESECGGVATIMEILDL